MKPDTVGEDEAVARLLLSVMEQRYDAAPPTPGWGQISGRLQQIRRRRRRRAAIGMGAGLLVLGVAGAAMVTDLPDGHHAPPASTNGKSLDLNRRSPLGSDAGTERPSVLDGRVRGSLAADRDWLQALRAQVAASKPWSYGGEQTWQPPTADAVSVLFAGDLGDRRFALVEGTWRSGGTARRGQSWYTGELGAAAGQMAAAGVVNATDTPSLVEDARSIRRGSTVPNETSEGHAVMLSSGPDDVLLEEPPSIDPDGKLTRHIRQVIGSDDVYFVSVSGPGRYILSVGGDDVKRDFYGSVTDLGVSLTDLKHKPLNPSNVATNDPARGGTRPRLGALERFAEQSWAIVDQPLGRGEFRLLASSRSPSTEDLELVGLLTLPTGARVVIGGEVGEKSEDYQQLIPLAAQLLPAGDPDDISVTWRIPEVHGRTTDQDPESQTPGLSVAMGPARTTTIRWTYRDGSVSSSATSNSLGVNQRDDVTSVTFLGKNGESLGTAEVREAIGNASTGPTDKNGYRWTTMRHENWLLPEVAAARTRS